MNKSKTVLRFFSLVASLAVILGGMWGIRLYSRTQDAQWQTAKEIYKIQSTLQEVDKSWGMESLSEVRPFEIRSKNGASIYYYCCITTYLNEESEKLEGLNKAALRQVVDVETLKNPRDCKVGGLDAVMGEVNEKMFLCWTISPEYSCVMAYDPETVMESDIFQIAESVKVGAY